MNFLRGILGVIAGWIILFIIMFVCLTVVYLAMGTNGTFLPASYVPNLTWLVIMAVVSIIAAVVGGYVCAAVSGSRLAVAVFAVLVLVFGFATAAYKIGSPGADEVRPAIVSNFEAMGKARTPSWYLLASPIFNALGIAIGGRMRQQG